jgi:hypothetical protein
MSPICYDGEATMYFVGAISFVFAKVKSFRFLLFIEFNGCFTS